MELKKVFACGVSWGNEKPSYFEEFKNNNSAILGSYNRKIEYFRDLKVGDLIAAKDGFKIIAIGEVTSVSENEIDIIEVNKWIELKKVIEYKLQGTGIIRDEETVKKCNEVFSRN